LGIIGLVLTLAYLLVAFNVLFRATQVFGARIGAVNPETTSPGMIFPLMVVKRHQKLGKPDEDLYLRRLLNARPQDLLHDYANQIIEISSIYQHRQKKLNESVKQFQWLSVVWVVTALVLVG